MWKLWITGLEDSIDGLASTFDILPQKRFLSFVGLSCVALSCVYSPVEAQSRVMHGISQRYDGYREWRNEEQKCKEDDDKYGAL